MYFEPPKPAKKIDGIFRKQKPNYKTTGTFARNIKFTYVCMPDYYVRLPHEE